MRVVLVGGRSFAVAVLNDLLGQDHDVVAVWTDDDALRSAALEKGILVWDPESHNVGGRMRRLEVDVLVSAHNYRKIRKAAREAPKYGAIGYHPSLLPKYRGKDGVEQTIASGDKIGGGSIYQLDDGWDTGRVIKQRQCQVREGWTASDLWREKLFGFGVALIREVLAEWETQVPVKTMQKAMELSGLNSAQVAYNMEWVNARGSADVSRVKRTIGLTDQHGVWRVTVERELATRLLRAMHVDPVDVDM